MRPLHVRAGRFSDTGSPVRRPDLDDSGGEGGIRTRGAFAHRFSRAAPSTTRTPLRGRGYQTRPRQPGRRRSTRGEWREQRLGFVAPDAADDLDPPRQTGMLSELDDGSRGAIVPVRDGEHERLDIALEERADAHRARLLGGEDGRVGEPDGPELSGGFAKYDDDGMGGRIVRLLDAVMGADDHRLVDHRDRGIRPLTVGESGPSLRQGLAHEQLVVHATMLADRFGRSGPRAATRDAESQPGTRRSGR